jgi:hypothetical protein
MRMEVVSSLKLQAAAGNAVECAITHYVMCIYSSKLSVYNHYNRKHFVDSECLCAVVWQPQSDWCHPKQAQAQHTPNSTTQLR